MGEVLPSFEGSSAILKGSLAGADSQSVSATAPAAVSSDPLKGDALIEFARESEHRSLAGAGPVAFIAALFVAASAALFLLSPERPLSLTALLVSIVCYALAGSVQFEYATFFAVPTEGLFVAMWFLLPPRMLPVAVCCGLLLASAPAIVRRRMPVERLAIIIASAWFSVGPALVLWAIGPKPPSWQEAPVYAGVLGSQFAIDVVSQFALARTVVRISPLQFAREAVPSLSVDTMLAPLGLLVAFPAYHHPWVLFMLMPVLFLFSTFSKERQQRIDGALELSSAYRGTAMLLGDVIEADDEYTGSHSRDVVELTARVAEALGLGERELQRAEFAAMLHDVGKVKIPAAIINKQGPLDDDEWALMRTHTVLGEEMLDTVGGVLGDVGDVVRSCHEHWDGGGYPDGLAGEEIPLAARIVCACDAWSAMTTDRPYRPARLRSEALAELERSAGTHFDPQVVDTLLSVLEPGRRLESAPPRHT